jgi:hypothetical protein
LLEFAYRAERGRVAFLVIDTNDMRRAAVALIARPSPLRCAPVDEVASDDVLAAVVATRRSVSSDAI